MEAKKKIWLSLAKMSGYELKYVQEAFDTNWVTPLGPNVDAFEKSLQIYLFRSQEEGNVVALNSGTSALHLSLIHLGVSAGDEVLCQTFTFVATANVIKYLGATPVFVDSEFTTWNMSPAKLRDTILWRISVTGRKPKAIIFVNLYGMPARIDEILSVANEFSIPVVEDAAESLGSEYKGRSCGTFGDIGVLSFNGNKIITTSGGGALICRNKDIAKRTMFLATQAREQAPHYQHEEVGYNYRLSNISAGIGRGQLLELEEFIYARRRNHVLYTRLLANVDGISVHQNPSDDYKSNFWLTCIVIDASKFGATSDEIRELLASEEIESRPLWKPMHLQPVYKNEPYIGGNVAAELFKNGLCLPSGAGLSNDDIHRVVSVILSLHKKKSIPVYKRERRHVQIDFHRLFSYILPGKKIEVSLTNRLTAGSLKIISMLHFPF
jgi:dTDP-4-amino-4,6-dideoxygalactose transaminase